MKILRLSLHNLASLTGTTTTDVEAVISAVQLDSLHVLDEDQI